MKKGLIIGSILLVVLAGAGAAWYFLFAKNLNGQIVVPYIAHQKPHIDPHVPAADAMSDKLDEVIFDGLFNVSANASGLTYEDGLGEFIGIDPNKVVTIKLKPQKKWHSSYNVAMEKEKITISDKQAIEFAAKDLQFTLSRIQKLGSLSPDYILIGQAIKGFNFTGPDANGQIQFSFRGDREWTEADIKEILSFKVISESSGINAPEYKDGTGPYLLAGQYEDVIYFPKNPAGTTLIPNLILKPFIDNSTYATELKNHNINAILSTPFGAVSPILRDSTRFFCKSNISNCFFAVLFNCDKLSQPQRAAARKLLDNRAIMERFFKIGSPQQRHIADYRGHNDNYEDLVNNSIFPSTSYYVEEQVVMPYVDSLPVDQSVLPDTIRIQVCLNYGYREELAEIADIINDPSLFNGRFKVTAVQNEELSKGNYDAVLVPVSGYRSNFLFDLYEIFLREPDMAAHRINLVTSVDEAGKTIIDPKSFENSRNLFRLDLGKESAEKENIKALLADIFGFMATTEIGDKQEYARRIDAADHQLALGRWLFSLPSLAYFSGQFEPGSIDLYGVASQLSTIEKWQEKAKKK